MSVITRYWYCWTYCRPSKHDKKEEKDEGKLSPKEEREMLQEIANELDDLKAEGQKLGLRDSPDVEEQDLDDLEEIDERLEDPNFDMKVIWSNQMLDKFYFRKKNLSLKLYPMKISVNYPQNRWKYLQSQIFLMLILHLILILSNIRRLIDQKIHHQTYQGTLDRLIKIGKFQNYSQIMVISGQGFEISFQNE